MLKHAGFSELALRLPRSPEAAGASIRRVSQISMPCIPALDPARVALGSFSQQGAYWPENALLPILDAGPRTWKAALIGPVPKCSPASHMCIQKFRKVRERSGTYALEFPDTIIFLTIGHRLSLKKNKWRTILESQVIQSQLLTSDKLNVLVLQMEFGTINTAKWVR